MLTSIQTEKSFATGTRRKEPRSYISIPLKLHSPDQSPLVIRTENLSRYGACLVTPVPLEIGAVVTLTCLNDECEMRATVKYVRQADDGWRAGVEFVAFPKKWLIMQLAVSALLEGGQIKPRRRRIRG
jgi:hypothetical protein